MYNRQSKTNETSQTNEDINKQFHQWPLKKIYEEQSKRQSFCYRN